MRASPGSFVLAILTACGPRPADDTGGDAGSSSGGAPATSTDAPTSSDSPTSDSPTTDSGGETTDSGGETTGETPPAGVCGQPRPDVAGFDLQLSLDPPSDPGAPPTVVEAYGTIVARLTSGTQDGLVIHCPFASGDLVVTVTYDSQHAPLPAGAVEGVVVFVRYWTHAAESEQRAILVEGVQEPGIILAANQGSGLLPVVEGMGVFDDFWTPLAVTDAPGGCPGMPGSCTTEVQRAGLRFVLDDQALELFDHQLGQIGSHTVQLGDVIHEISADNFCEGGSDTRQDFLLVHD